MLFIATPTLGVARTQWGLAVGGHTWPIGRNRSHIAIMNMTTVGARNLAIYMALRDEKFDFLMFWDDDIIPRTVHACIDLVSTMAQHDEIDILGAVYPRRHEPPEPIVVKEDGHGAWWGWKDGGLHEVYLTGTGFTLMRCSSLRKLVVPKEMAVGGEELGVYFDTQEGFSDDFWFARIAREQGLKWYVHGGVVCDQVDLNGKRWQVEDAYHGELGLGNSENFVNYDVPTLEPVIAQPDSETQFGSSAA